MCRSISRKIWWVISWVSLLPPATSEGMRAARAKKPQPCGRRRNERKPMEVRAIARDIGIPPRKVRLVTDAVKGRKVTEALAILKFLPNAAARPISKVVASAAANAENNYSLDPNELYIIHIVADSAAMAKRQRA